MTLFQAFGASFTMAEYEKYRYGDPEDTCGGVVAPEPTYEAYAHTGAPSGYDDKDVFGHEENHAIKYKTLSWYMVAAIMIAEIVSNGMLSLPSALAAVGIVPGVILIIFLGIFATYTSWVLIQFKLRHAEVHSMGDAGYILFGPLGREVFAAGTVIFAIFATGSQLFAGEVALATLSDSKLCTMVYTGIFAAATLVVSFPRTLDQLSVLSVLSCVCILIAGIVGMAASGAFPAAERHVDIAISSDFATAFIAITNPVFAYAGHFMFFIMISEMKRPQDAMKAAYTLQGFATTYYVVFAIVSYVYLGPSVTSPSFSSLPTKWAKVAYGIALPNFLIAGALYAHTASKLFFIRIFRQSTHLHEHTLIGWSTWTILIIVCNGAAFVLAVGVPIFNYLVGIAASLFASWYTYGIAGAFWLHDIYHDKGGFRAWVQRPFMTSLNVATFLAGGFICISGLYATIKGIIDAYDTGAVSEPFAC